MILSRLSSSLIPCAYGLIFRDGFRNLLSAFGMFHERSVPAGRACRCSYHTDFEKKKSSQRSPYHLEIHLSGQLDGQAMVRWTDSQGTLVREAAISGDVDLRWGSEWYESRASLHYQPGDVSSGELEVNYRFEDP